MRPQCAQTCSGCPLRELCLPAGLPNADVGRFEPLVRQATPLSTGAMLFAQGDRFDSLYAVRSGSLKTSLVDEDGCEQVVSLSQPGGYARFRCDGRRRALLLCAAAIGVGQRTDCRLILRYRLATENDFLTVYEAQPSNRKVMLVLYSNPVTRRRRREHRSGPA